MEEDVMVINSPFLKGIIEKIIHKKVRQAKGFDADVKLNQVSVNHSNNTTRIHINADLCIDDENLKSLLKQLL